MSDSTSKQSEIEIIDCSMANDDPSSLRESVIQFTASENKIGENEEGKKSSSKEKDEQMDDRDKEKSVVRSQNNETEHDVPLLVIKRRDGKSRTSHSSNRKRGRLQEDTRSGISCGPKTPKKNIEIPVIDLTLNSDAQEGACKVLLVKRRDGKSRTSHSGNRKRGKLQEDTRSGISCGPKTPKKNIEIPVIDLTLNSDAQEGACKGKNDEEQKSSSIGRDKQMDDTNKEQSVGRSQNEETEHEVTRKNDEEEKSSSIENDKQIDDTNKEEIVGRSQNEETEHEVPLLLIKRRDGKSRTSHSSNRKRGRLQEDTRSGISCGPKTPKKNIEIPVIDLTLNSDAQEGACKVIDPRD